MSNGDIDRWYDLALANGAVGGKLIGAGGGGFLMFYAADKTRLRHVMTAQGLRVFKGASHFPYHPSGFVSLSQASSFVAGNKKQLRNVQLAFEGIDAPVTQVAELTTGRSVGVASAASIVDLGGKQIRYVGP